MPIKSGPTSFEEEMAAVARKRKLAETMLQSSMADKASGEMVGGHYISHGLSNGVSDLVNAFLARNMNEKADASAQDISARKAQAMQDELSGYMATREGQAGKDIPYSEDQIRNMMLNEQELPGQERTPDIAANPRAAAIKAVASQFPQLQQLGALDFQEMRKKPVEEEWHDPKEMSINGKPGMVQFGKRGGQRVIEGAAPIPKEPLVKVDMGQKVEENANKKLGEASIDEIVGSKKEAQKAQASYEYLQSIKPALKQAITGFGADPKLMLTKLYTAFGGADDGTITTTEQLSSALAQKVLDNTKTLGSGSGFTDKDREYLEKVVQGKLSLDPATIQHALNAGIADAWNKMNGHQGLLGTVAGNKELGFSPEKLSAFRTETPDLESVNPGGDARDFTFDTKTQRLIANPFPTAHKPGVGVSTKTVSKVPQGKVMSADEFLKAKGF